jgi:hypothetical protein
MTQPCRVSVDVSTRLWILCQMYLVGSKSETAAIIILEPSGLVDSVLEAGGPIPPPLQACVETPTAGDLWGWSICLYNFLPLCSLQPFGTQSRWVLGQ